MENVLPESKSRLTTDTETNTETISSYKVPSSQSAMPANAKKQTVVFLIIALVAGVSTGFGVYKLQARSETTFNGKEIQEVASGSVNNGDVFGSPNKDIFKDSAEGYLQAGGLDGEGSHSLIRPGGASQTVYLTSSATDLSKLEGMDVKVWGETFKGQKAGWLMDVGRVEIVNVQGTAPVEE